MAEEKKKKEESEIKHGEKITDDKTIRQLAEKLERVANKYSYSDEYGLRRPGNSTKPKMDNLCCRCECSTIYRRASSMDYQIRCETVGLRESAYLIAHDIKECSSFSGQNQMSLMMMIQMAVMISDKKNDSGGHYL